jgi:hypothetical protein
MPKMVSLQKPKAAKSNRGAEVARPWSDPDNKGVRVELEHHHLMALKGKDGKPIAGRLKSGHEVVLHGRARVERSESRSTEDGERHSATLRIHHGAVDHNEQPAERREAPKKRGKGEPRYPGNVGEYLER